MTRGDVMSSSKKVLKLGLPKGSLQESTVELFRRAGIRIGSSDRSYLRSKDLARPLAARPRTRRPFWSLTTSYRLIEEFARMTAVTNMSPNDNS